MALIVVDRSGTEHSLQAKSNQTVMEAIREAGFDEMLALCGGCCSCATCHVHVDPAFSELLVPVSQDENDLLEGSSHFTAHSRLSCEIQLHDGVSGLRVAIAQED